MKITMNMQAPQLSVTRIKEKLLSIEERLKKAKQEGHDKVKMAECVYELEQLIDHQDVFVELKEGRVRYFERLITSQDFKAQRLILHGIISRMASLLVFILQNTTTERKIEGEKAKKRTIWEYLNDSGSGFFIFMKNTNDNRRNYEPFDMSKLLESQESGDQERTHKDEQRQSDVTDIGMLLESLKEPDNFYLPDDNFATYHGIDELFEPHAMKEFLRQYTYFRDNLINGLFFQWSLDQVPLREVTALQNLVVEYDSEWLKFHDLCFNTPKTLNVGAWCRFYPDSGTYPWTVDRKADSAPVIIEDLRDELDRTPERSLVPNGSDRIVPDDKAIILDRRVRLCDNEKRHKVLWLDMSGTEDWAVVKLSPLEHRTLRYLYDIRFYKAQANCIHPKDLSSLPSIKATFKAIKNVPSKISNKIQSQTQPEAIDSAWLRLICSNTEGRWFLNKRLDCYENKRK